MKGSDLNGSYCDMKRYVDQTVHDTNVQFTEAAGERECKEADMTLAESVFREGFNNIVDDNCHRLNGNDQFGF